MKKLLALCFIVSFFLFQSCSSYKYIDYDSVRADKNQKFKVVMLDNLKIKGSLVNKDDKNLYLIRWDGKTIKIPKEGIYDLKIKRFSYFRTGGLILSPIVGYLFISWFFNGIGGAAMY